MTVEARAVQVAGGGVDRPARRGRRLVGTVVLLAGLVLAASACVPKPTWISGRTHGPIIEAGAARGSIGIYRVPRRALYSWYRAQGIRAAADLLWNVGKPPYTSFEVAGVEVGTNYLQYKFHGFIYGDLDDLEGALNDAQDAGDCLALTLISRGAYNKNWTHKSVSCRDGSIG